MAVSAGTIRNFRQRNSLKPNNQSERNIEKIAESRRIKLKPSQISTIFRLHTDGHSDIEISKRLSIEVSPQYIRNFRKKHGLKSNWGSDKHKANLSKSKRLKIYRGEILSPGQFNSIKARRQSFELGWCKPFTPLERQIAGVLYENNEWLTLTEIKTKLNRRDDAYLWKVLSRMVHLKYLKKTEYRYRLRRGVRINSRPIKATQATPAAEASLSGKETA